MMITIKKLDQSQIDELNIMSWPIWTKEKSIFDWHYDETEECLLIEGKVKVTANNEEVIFGKGDFVSFPKGLSCTWEVIEPVKKHYNFK